MGETKQNILLAAERLFFLHGIANVRLQQIADEAGISVGNLAYHYRNKEAIVEAVYEKMFGDFESLLAGYLKSPDLRDFDELFLACYHTFTENAFYLNNIWEINRNYEELRSRWQQFNQKMVVQIKKRIQFNLERGAFSHSPLLSQLDEVAQNLWLTSTFWISQQLLLGKKHNPTRYRKALWSLLTPYLTAAGTRELELILTEN